MIAKTNRGALPTRQLNADSKALQERDVLGAIASATNVVASGPSRSTLAPMLTKSMTWRFQNCAIQTHKFLVFFFFAGRGTWSQAVVQAGFSVLSIDHENNGAEVPRVMLDLTSSSGVKMLWDMFSRHQMWLQ